MNKVRVCIWGRNFELNVSYQNFPGEEVTKNQEYTLEALPSVDFTEALSKVEQYIMKYNASEISGNSVDNIFKYIMPKSVVITRDESVRVFAIMCNYKFDMENGIAIVYENEKYKAVGPQDLIL